MEGEGTKAPQSPDYVNLSEYPPGTDIESELHWDGCRVVLKVPRWAHEKWLLKNQNAADREEDHPDGGKRPCEDHPNSASAAAAASSGTKALKRPCEDLVQIPSETAAANGGKRLRMVYPSSASATADAAASGAKTLKRPCVEIPPETVAAYAEVIGLNPRFAKVYPDVYSYHRHPDRYGFYLEKGRIVCKVKKWAGPIITSKVEGGFLPPKPLKDDHPSAGTRVENHVSPPVFALEPREPACSPTLTPST